MPGMPTVAGPMLKVRALPKFAPTLPRPSLSQEPPVTVIATGFCNVAPALPAACAWTAAPAAAAGGGPRRGRRAAGRARLACKVISVPGIVVVLRRRSPAAPISYNIPAGIAILFRREAKKPLRRQARP